MDPLSVTASSLALLAAIKAAHLLINKIVDAPETLASAQSDIEFTISSVQALCAYLGDHSEATLIARGELLRVIDACTGSCDAFQHLLQECSKHSVERVDGKLSLLDRGKILLKDKSIREFRGDLACFRGAINIAAFPLLISSTEGTNHVIEKLVTQLETTGSDVRQRLDYIRRRIEDLEDAGILSENAAMIALKAREEAFAECQQLMEESAKAAEKCESFQGTYGNLVVDAEGIAFEGLATDRLFKKVSLAYKDTKVGSRAIAMRALADPDVTKSFYMYATAAARSSNGRHGSGTDAPGAADARSPEMASDDPSISEQHIGLRTTTQRPSMIENWEAPCPWADLRASQDTRRDNAKSRQTTTVRR